jgi:hypothetical protein
MIGRPAKRCWPGFFYCINILILHQYPNTGESAGDLSHGRNSLFSARNGRSTHYRDAQQSVNTGILRVLNVESPVRDK